MIKTSPVDIFHSLISILCSPFSTPCTSHTRPRNLPEFFGYNHPHETMAILGGTADQRIFPVLGVQQD